MVVKVRAKLVGGGADTGDGISDSDEGITVDLGGRVRERDGRGRGSRGGRGGWQGRGEANAVDVAIAVADAVDGKDIMGKYVVVGEDEEEYARVRPVQGDRQR